MRYKNRLFSLVLLRFAFVLGLSGCTREDDPDSTAMYEGLMRGSWEVNVHTRGSVDMQDATRGYFFSFDDAEGVFVGRGLEDVSVRGDWRAFESGGLTWLHLEFSPASSIDSIGGDWQALDISHRAANFARRAVTGEIERLEFRQQ
jgi:hypothetical protein